MKSQLNLAEILLESSQKYFSLENKTSKTKLSVTTFDKKKRFLMIVTYTDQTNCHAAISESLND